MGSFPRSTAGRRWQRLSDLLLLTSAAESASEILPSLGLLLHSVRVAPAEAPSLADSPPADAVLVDARRDLAQAKSLCHLLRTASLDGPLLIIVTEGGLAAVTAEWGADDVILHTAGPAEVEARLRLAMLGVEHEALIGTVRNVGYRFVPAKSAEDGRVPHGARPPEDDSAPEEDEQREASAASAER